MATCEPGWETPLRDELRRQFPAAAVTWPQPGWVIAERAEPPIQPPFAAFARQVLPGASELAFPSVSRFANAIAEQIVSRLDRLSGPWRWHVFRVDSEAADVPGQQRCVLIRDAVLEQLSRRFRRLVRRAHVDSRPEFAADESFVQFALRTASVGELSILTPEELAPWRHAVSGWCGGDVLVEHDRDAPSRACHKLYEAQLRWGRPIERGETCVDLGASPGGWTWVALRRGAIVTAVDRSPPRADLLEHPRLTFVSGDAFQFVPPAPVDWLLSDVIAFPSRILELLRSWLEQRWCRRFCVTIKFRGREEDALLADFTSLLAARTSSFELRRMNANANEVTAWGSVRTH